MPDRSPPADVLALTVLAFLTERPMHPYDVQRVIRQRHKDYAIERPRALYRAFERLAQLLERPVVEDPVFGVAVGFVGYLNPGAVLEALQDRFASLEGEVAGLDAALQAMLTSLPRLVLLQHEYRRALRQAERDWVQKLIEDIRASKLSWDLEALVRHFAAIREGGRQMP